jgi:predicted Ser/Thr protein kinase
VGPSADELLSSISSTVRQTFREDRSVLSYGEWFNLLLESPARNLRSSAQYLRDVFDHFGVEERPLPRGTVRRYRLFDAPWAGGDGRVAGQESVQNELYRLINNFVRDGRVSRLIMLHGPNGSAKSSIIHCVQKAMESYSRTGEGAMYSYAWIFPSDKIMKSRLGFDSGPAGSGSRDSYAHLSAEQVDARLPCELRDHPIFFVPPRDRQRLLQQLVELGRLPADFVPSRYILEGDLSPRDRAIYDALLKAYDGDHAEVLRHVQVERFYFSLRYGSGLGTVEPQMHVDAEARQITADRSVTNLPRPLQTVPLYELHGPLVSSNRGLLEFADLLKRPAEAYKYLLITSEEATASLPQFKIDLDQVLIASTNEKYLEAFKDHPDWMSFKARIELVRVPYLLRFSDEVEIYERQISPTSFSREVAPHVMEAAAMWAVLTRLKYPDPEHFDEPLKAIVENLSPMEKLRLYDTGETPDWVSAADAKVLTAGIPQVFDEYRNVPYYEGRLGASARELRTVILNAAHHPNHHCLNPIAVFDELRELVRDPSLYEFLKQENRNGYHENQRFIDVVRDWWLDRFDDEVRVSMGLVEEARYEDLFARYVRHVSQYLKKEKIFNEVTGAHEDPDQHLMKEVEDQLLSEGEDREDFRRALIERIGAWSLEHSGETPQYRRLFARYIERMEEQYYSRQRQVIARNLRNLLASRNGESEPEAKAEADRTLTVLKERYGYSETCAVECVAHLLRLRYFDAG